MLRRITAVAITVAIAVPTPALACMWDHDTLRQERARFPHALELITGKFLRHSTEAYEWRIRDRTARLAKAPRDLALHDDLAVAYHKVGRPAQAIATMEAAERLAPDRYETQANLGTFYILDGDLERGLAYITKALAINPDAHFGRERYQKWLVEYALGKRVAGKLQLPLRGVAHDHRDGGFRQFLASAAKQDHLPREDAAKALTGVLGMMRFANHDNPLLLEALGDLLVSRGDMRDAKQLAARAYLQASRVVADPAAKAAYRELAASAISMQMTPGELGDVIELETIELQLASELAEGAAWYARLRARELGWIRDGADVDAEFDRLYAEEPEVSAALNTMLQPLDLLDLTVVIMSLALGVVVLLRRLRRRRA